MFLTCKHCHKKKKVDKKNFVVESRSKLGFKTTCKECLNVRRRKSGTMSDDALLPIGAMMKGKVLKVDNFITADEFFSPKTILKTKKTFNKGEQSITLLEAIERVSKVGFLTITVSKNGGVKIAQHEGRKTTARKCSLDELHATLMKYL